VPREDSTIDFQVAPITEEIADPEMALSERGIYFAAISPRWIDKREHYLCVNVIWKIWCSTMK